MGIERCPLCDWDAEVKVHLSGSYSYECKTCGRYILTGLLRRALPPESEQDKALFQYLKAYTRQASEPGDEIPLLDVSDWRNAARAHAGTPIAVKLRKLMHLIAKRSGGIGGRGELVADRDYPLIDALSLRSRCR